MKRTNGESGQRSAFSFKVSNKIEVSRGGVLFSWVLLQRKQEKDTLILDTCKTSFRCVISFCAKKHNEGKATVEKSSAFPSRFPQHRSLWRGCPFKMGFATEKGRKGRPKHSNSLNKVAPRW